MCLIIVSPPNTTPDWERVADATWDNPNGSGWAVRSPGGLITMRSARDIQNVYDAFMATRTRYPQSWAMWHSRYTTQGYDCDDNTHPFEVPGRPWVMAHNGVMPLNDGPLDDRDRSDSRILAEDILSETDWATLVAERERIEDWLAGDKVVVLSAVKERGGPCLILGEHHGMWDRADGCWYSCRTHPYRCNTCHKAYRRCDCPPKSWGYKKQAATGMTLMGESSAAYAAWWEEQDRREAEELGRYLLGIGAGDDET